MRRTRTSDALLCAGLVACAGAGERASAHPPPADRPRLVIVAPTALRASLHEFVEFKRTTVIVEDVSIEDVLASASGCDDAERLKRWLYDAWKERGASHVLLVGDADVMPVRYMVLDRVTPEAFDYAFYPSDLYYADVADRDGAFDDWNARKDGFHAQYFGEVRGEKNKTDPINFDRVDYRPELGVGRWPVSTPDEVRTVAVKSMACETRRGGSCSAAFVVAGGWVDARPRFDRLARALPGGWTHTAYYYSDSPGTSPTPNADQIVGAVNSGVFLTIHGGHGNDNVWEGCLSVRDIPRLQGVGAPGVMMSVGCSTARFATLPPYEPYTDAHGVEHAGTNAGEVFTAPPPPPSCYARGTHNMTGLGERLLRDGTFGAAAYIGCNTGSQPCALTLADGFIESLGTGAARRLGDCWAGAVAYYVEHEQLASLVPDDGWYPASIFFQGMKFMLFGDPTLPMPSGTDESRAIAPTR